ncbi:S8 family serine peptidase [Heliobacterium undosum]|uniref:S8 family serine peptidase n=1 Tax=Heliomicrobium undosum TaxID=121734 RepID=A0A845L7R8_9FIRM|nr:S8 family serine peptidase [Heliomicrobium undosum]MZP31085.1 S8 family serine peptidase [Heliomicrobium undosum]
MLERTFQKAPIPGQVIVKYRSPESAKKRPALKILADSQKKLAAAEAFLLEVPKNRSTGELLDELRRDADVEYAELNHRVRPAGTTGSVNTNDTFFDQQWGLAAIHAPEAWDALQKATGIVKLAVVDSGVDVNHPDLAGRVLASEGMNFVSLPKPDGSPYSDPHDLTDEMGHGTFVSSVAAAVNANGMGIAGVSGPANVLILPVKVMGAEGGTVYDTALGIRYAADHGAAVINLSLETDEESKVLAEAVHYARKQGALVVAAAGNGGTDADRVYPAAYPGVLTVGAIMPDKTIADFSNSGHCVELVAPGVDIAGALPAEIGQYFGELDQGGYYYLNGAGTSFATPMVAATAALYKLTHPGAKAAQISHALTKSAGDLGRPGRDEQYGFGLLNAGAALSGPTETLSGE